MVCNRHFLKNDSLNVKDPHLEYLHMKICDSWDLLGDRRWEVGRDRQDPYEVPIVEVGWWVHEGSLYYSVHIYMLT